MIVKSVVLENVVKRYPGFELNINRLELVRGLNLIIGPNGSGKSTLLKLIAGFIKPNKGAIRIITSKGEIPTGQAYKIISYVAEDVSFPNMKVHEILSAFATDEEHLKDVIELLELGSFLNRRYLELSAGYRKRVQIAIALLKKAQVLLLDEPFSNLDIIMIAPLRNIIKKLSKERLVVVTSHIDLGVIPDNLVILNQGVVVYSGEPSAIIHPRYTLTARIGNDIRKVTLEELNDLIKDKNITIERIEARDLFVVLRNLLRSKKV
ncbi:MAG: ABC transporter ATP-binding protein [Thermoprotei archaeon]|nr:MAG: ABC transporter ATP-binding protein [Thermoprotei archaeon]RLF20548.1 MAG: ABC transporter ATP-binding protein [Thermoprotei archaeon]